MSKGYLLDTNIAIAILINEGIVIDFVQQASRDKMGDSDMSFIQSELEIPLIFPNENCLRAGFFMENSAGLLLPPHDRYNCETQ